MSRCEGGKIRHGDLLEVQDTRTPNPLDLRRGGCDQKEGLRSRGHEIRVDSLLQLALN
jgi:hypothetical protein